MNIKNIVILSKINFYQVEKKLSSIQNSLIFFLFRKCHILGLFHDIKIYIKLVRNFVSCKKKDVTLNSNCLNENSQHFFQLFALFIMSLFIIECNI